MLRSVALALSVAAGAVLFAPAAGAASPVPSRPAVRAPIAEPSVSPGDDQRAVPTVRPSVGSGGADIDVPAGRATVPATGHGSELALVALAGGGALLLAGGTVVAVARRRA